MAQAKTQKAAATVTLPVFTRVRDTVNFAVFETPNSENAKRPLTMYVRLSDAAKLDDSNFITVTLTAVDKP